MLRHTMTCNATQYNLCIVIWCHTMQHHAHHAEQRHPHHTVPFYAMQYHITPFIAMQDLEKQYHTLLRRGVTSCHPMEFLDIQRHALPCNTMQCHVTPCNDMICQAISCNAMPHQSTPCHTMQRHETPWHAMPCHIKPFHEIPYNAMPCHATPAIPRHAMSCNFFHVMPYHAMQCNATPRHATTHHATPFNAMQHHTTPWNTIQCHTKYVTLHQNWHKIVATMYHHTKGTNCRKICHIAPKIGTIPELPYAIIPYYDSIHLPPNMSHCTQNWHMIIASIYNPFPLE